MNPLNALAGGGNALTAATGTDSGQQQFQKALAQAVVTAGEMVGPQFISQMREALNDDPDAS